MGSRGNARRWGWLLIALAVVALAWAGLEWWYQSSGQQVLDGFVPHDVTTIPIDWDQERLHSQIRMALALVAAGALSAGGVLLLRRRKSERLPVA
jgi:hypothetical protein